MMKNSKAKSAHALTPVSQKNIVEVHIVLAVATNSGIHMKKTNKSEKEDRQSLFLFNGNPLCVRCGLRSGLTARGLKRASPTRMMDHATTYDHTSTEIKGGHITYLIKQSTILTAIISPLHSLFKQLH